MTPGTAVTPGTAGAVTARCVCVCVGMLNPPFRAAARSRRPHTGRDCHTRKRNLTPSPGTADIAAGHPSGHHIPFPTAKNPPQTCRGLCPRTFPLGTARNFSASQTRFGLAALLFGDAAVNNSPGGSCSPPTPPTPLPTLRLSRCLCIHAFLALPRQRARNKAAPG